MRKLNHFLTTVSFILLFALGCNKETSVAPVATNFETQKPSNFSDAYQIAGKYNPQENILTIKVSLVNGFHAYAPGEQIGKPVSLTISPKNSWRIDGDVKLPTGNKKRLEFQESSVVLTGEFVITARVVGGVGPIEARLALQVCSDKLCDRPREHTILIDPKSN